MGCIWSNEAHWEAATGLARKNSRYCAKANNIPVMKGFDNLEEKKSDKMRTRRRMGPDIIGRNKDKQPDDIHESIETCMQILMGENGARITEAIHSSAQ
jgi:hypothetical protein